MFSLVRGPCSLRDFAAPRLCGEEVTRYPDNSGINYKNMEKIVLITGATSGIGKACALKFAQHGFDLIITGRRKERLEKLQRDIESQFDQRVLPLTFDIRDKAEVEKAIGSLDSDWENIDILINNAGLALDLKPILDGDFSGWDTMIDTNLKGLLYITKLLAKKMVDRRAGHIINIGSIAGRDTYPKGNVYCATKFAVDGLTKAMRLDLLPYGIRVSQIAPGAVETEFSEVRFKGDSDRAKRVYQGYQPLSADDVADAVFYVASRPSHVNINDLLIMPTAQANATKFNKETEY
jgi:NADP-dependent 3-hydroxy acid dehydrogenase YdfG